ncbi:hypothetical protein TNCV_2574521 [Trichonephila clavipes]|nr:hypothetical protein TNCV_2574521 [Trichonephila clavipes]
MFPSGGQSDTKLHALSSQAILVVNYRPEGIEGMKSCVNLAQPARNSNLGNVVWKRDVLTTQQLGFIYIYQQAWGLPRAGKMNPGISTYATKPR